MHIEVVSKKRKNSHSTIDVAVIHLPYCELTAERNIFVYNSDAKVHKTTQKT